jgi:hypothetical protein
MMLWAILLWAFDGDPMDLRSIRGGLRAQRPDLASHIGE